MAVLMSYLADCLDSFSKRRSTDPRIYHSHLGIILPISSSIHQFNHEYGLFDTLRGTSFDATLSLLAYSRTFKIDWSRHGVNNAFFLYDRDCIEVV